MDQVVERFGKLTEAAQETLRAEVQGIEEALLRIRAACDETSHECTCCHMKIRHSWRDTQLADTLRGFRTKLRRWEEEAGGRKGL
jgi:hypothetical protein